MRIPHTFDTCRHQHSLVTHKSQEMRIVLSWGDFHSDMDSYLLVPQETSSSAVTKIFYGNKQTSGADGSSANLDVDDTDYYGPETTTITNPRPGVYSYFVNIYGSPDICFDSGIQSKVEVWSGEKGGLTKSIDQPLENPPSLCGEEVTNTCGRYWHVFDFDGTTHEFSWKNDFVDSLPTSTSMTDEAFLPSISSCSCNTFSDGGLGSWMSATENAALDLSYSLLGDTGVAGSSLCHENVQEKFNSASMDSNPLTAASIVSKLGSKVEERFNNRVNMVNRMRDYVKASYSGSNAAPSQIPQPMCELECNEKSCPYDPPFNKNVNRNGYGLRYGARANAKGDNVREEDEGACAGLGSDMVASETGLFDTDPTTKWSYYGSEAGVNVIAPSRDGNPSSCKAYDPRLRPWYSEAMSKHKNLVVVLDGSGTASNAEFLSLKQGALAAIGTLAAGDTANVVIARWGQPDVTGADYMTDLTYDECQQDQMLRTSTINKDLLLRFINEAEQEQDSNKANLLTAIDTAQTLLAAQRTFKSNNYPDIESEDIVVILAASEWHGHTNADYANKKAELSPPAKWIVHGLEGSDIKNSWPGPVASAADVVNEMTVANAGFDPARYYTASGIAVSAPNANDQAPFASSFYTDSSGLGLVTTVVAPVSDGSKVRGVVGIDVTAMDLIGDLIFESGKFTSSYAFLVDSAGQTIWHPTLPSPDNKTAEPVDIKDLEISSGFLTNVRPGLVAGETGSATVMVDMPVARGDATYAGFSSVTRSVEYAWKPIAGTPFRACVAMTQDDASGKELASPPVDDICNTEMQCQVYHNLDLEQNCDKVSDFLGVAISKTSSIFFSASSFEGPAAWLEFPETKESAKKLAEATTCSTSSVPIFKNGVGKLKEEPINDYMLFRDGAVDRCWGNSQESNSELVWTYFGGSTGMFRMMPAGKTPKMYDHTRRAWYMAALANHWEDGDTSGYGLAMSTPYTDAFGAGEVITMSKAVKRGSDGSGDPVAGVVGVDLKLETVKRLVESEGNCGQADVQCILLDETGHIIYHRDFVATERSDSNVFIASKHREVADALSNAGVMTQNACFDYGSGMKKTSYSLSSTSTAGGALSCGNWALSKLGKTNVYLLALSSNGCIVASDKRNIECLPCNIDNCNTWDSSSMPSELLCQPCQCMTEYDSCAMKFGGSSGQQLKACPAAPPPLFEDVCGGDGFSDEDAAAAVAAIIGFVIAAVLACGCCCGTIMAKKNKENGSTARQTQAQPVPQAAKVSAPPQQHFTPVPQGPGGFAPPAQAGGFAPPPQMAMAYPQQGGVQMQQMGMVPVQQQGVTMGGGYPQQMSMGAPPPYQG